jgi:hypothetical protein
VNGSAKTLFAVVVLGVCLGARGVAYASPDATFNSCWGQSVKAFAALTPGIIGQHSRASSGVTPDPGDGGRQGVGNVSKNTQTPPATNNGDGEQGVHANNNLAGVGLPACDGPPSGSAMP